MLTGTIIEIAPDGIVAWINERQGRYFVQADDELCVDDKVEIQSVKEERETLFARK